METRKPIFYIISGKLALNLQMVQTIYTDKNIIYFRTSNQLLSKEFPTWTAAEEEFKAILRYCSPI